MATVQGWPYFRALKHTLGPSEVVTIRGWPNFKGGFALKVF